MFRVVQSGEPTRVLRLRRSFRLSVSASTPPAPSWAPGVTPGVRVPDVGRSDEAAVPPQSEREASPGCTTGRVGCRTTSCDGSGPVCRRGRCSCRSGRGPVSGFAPDRDPLRPALRHREFCRGEGRDRVTTSGQRLRGRVFRRDPERSWPEKGIDVDETASGPSKVVTVRTEGGVPVRTILTTIGLVAAAVFFGRTRLIDNVEFIQ